MATVIWLRMHKSISNFYAVSFGLFWMLILNVACSEPRTEPFRPESLTWLPEEVRISEAPQDTITAKMNIFNGEQYNLRISNSTQNTFEIFAPAGDDCFTKPFWLYFETPLGWKPLQAFHNFECNLHQTEDQRILIPGGLSKEFGVEVILGSRGLSPTKDARYMSKFMFRIRLFNSDGQKLYLYSDVFNVGQTTPSYTPSVSVESETSGDLKFRITNHSDLTMILAPMCSQFQVRKRLTDEESSSLQFLTSEKAWSYIRGKTGDCDMTLELIEISPGESNIIDGDEWVENAGLVLEPGRYRWDVVFYLNNTSLGVDERRHLFGPDIEYSK